MMRESVIEKWIETVDDYIIWGVPDDHYEDPEHLDNDFGDVVEEFCRVNKYSERTSNELLNVIDVRDAYYKTLSRNGYRLPCDAEYPSNNGKEGSDV